MTPDLFNGSGVAPPPEHVCCLLCHRRKAQALPAVKASVASCLFSSSSPPGRGIGHHWGGWSRPSDGAVAFALRGRSIILHGETGGINGLGQCKWSQNGVQLLHYQLQVSPLGQQNVSFRTSSYANCYAMTSLPIPVAALLLLYPTTS